jgi:stearoyl-CoA desaturase (Delta-9 desaturase)
MYAGIIDWPWWAYVLVALGLTHVTVMAVTIFLHRHQAHHALDLHLLPAHFFRFWLWLTTGMITREWVAVHRKHHVKCETEDDPHSPRIHGINRVLWGGVFLYVREARKLETLRIYGRGTPDDWLENHVYTPCPKIGILLMLIIDLALFGFLVGTVIWLVQMVWIPFWAAGVINGLGHFFGYRNFSSPDASTNIFPLGILVGGEELHNNHHTYITSAKLSNKWYEVDLGWIYICILAAMGLARVRKVAPVPHVGAVRLVVDEETLQAVVANRFDILARYDKSLRRIYREELAKLQNRAQFKGLKACLTMKASSVPENLRDRFEQLIGQSNALRTALKLREDLVALWAKTGSTREQLIAELQAWCQHAENSSVRRLQDIALRFRSYLIA